MVVSAFFVANEYHGLCPWFQKAVSFAHKCLLLEEKVGFVKQNSDEV